MFTNNTINEIPYKFRVNKICKKTQKINSNCDSCCSLDGSFDWSFCQNTLLTYAILEGECASFLDAASSWVDIYEDFPIEELEILENMHEFAEKNGFYKCLQ